MSEFPATTSDETPVFIPAGAATLFGVKTAPSQDARNICIVVLSGGGTPISTNVNRLSVRMCRRLASLGFDTFRFDYHGVGESSGVADRWHLASPFVPDLEAVLEFLRAQHLHRFVLVGSCFGARTCLSEAVVAADVGGVVLVSPPVRDFEMGHRTTTRMANMPIRQYATRALRVRTIRSLARAGNRRLYRRLAQEKLRQLVSRRRVGPSSDAKYRVSPLFTEPLQTLDARGVPTLLIYGDRDDLFLEFEEALRGPLRGLADSVNSSVTWQVIPGTVHGFRRIEAQDDVLERVTGWLLDLPSDAALTPEGKPRVEDAGYAHG